MRVAGSSPLSGVVLALLGCGCSSRLELGNDLIWTADQEQGDLSQWSEGAGSDVLLPSADATLEVTSEQAHRGNFALKLSNPVDWDNDEAGPEILHGAGPLSDAYYSAWFLLPEAYRLEPSMTLLRLRSRDPQSGELFNGEELQLRSLPGGGYVPLVFSNNSGFLLEPVAESPPRIEAGRWFQVEARYQPQSSGRLRVWVDGQLAYDLGERPGAAGSELVLGVCNVAEHAEPTPLVLFVDDAAISFSRVTPTGHF